MGDDSHGQSGSTSIGGEGMTDSTCSKMETVALKPCPFCNTDLSVMAGRICHPPFGCILDGFSFRDSGFSRQKWNKRASVLEPFPCSECEKPPRLVKKEKGWSIGCCSTRFWWYDTEEEAIRDWNKHWRNRRVKE